MSRQNDATTTSTGTEPAVQSRLRVPTSFSILFESERDADCTQTQPACFHDLNIDQLVDGIVSGRDEYDLRAFFNAPLRRVEAVYYRQGIFRELRSATVSISVRHFTDEMRFIREHFKQIDKLSEARQKHAWLLDAINHYCAACIALAEALRTHSPASDGFKRLLRYLDAYTASSRFTTLQSEALEIQAKLTDLKYKVIIEGSTFTVQRYEGEVDYSRDVKETFARFKQGSVKDHHSGKFREWPNMNHVEAKILEFVSLLYPEPFVQLNAFCQKHL